eukprot:Nk52_evm35s217 gene=Nk52_evmTU35s217
MSKLKKRDVPALDLKSTVPLTEEEQMANQALVAGACSTPREDRMSGIEDGTSKSVGSGLKGRINEVVEARKLSAISVNQIEDEYYEFKKVVSMTEFSGRDVFHMRLCEGSPCSTKCKATLKLLENKALRLHLYFQALEKETKSMSCDDFDVKSLVDDILVQCFTG